jgi:hypothetical protein
VTDLEHSARTLLRASHAPIALKPEARRAPGRAVAKYSFLANLRITPEEHRRLRRRLDLDPSVVTTVEAVANAKNTTFAPEIVPPFAGVEWDSLVSIGEALTKLREQDLEAFRDIHTAFLDSYEEERAERKARLLPPARGRTSSPGLGPQAGGNPKTPISVEAPTLTSALEWAVRNGVKATEARRFLHLLPQRFPAPTSATMADFETMAELSVWQSHNLVAAIKQYSAIEPVGLLHLERLNFVPAGIERGELVHSVPLSPGEEVNISHKEWSHTSEEFSRIVTDFMEAYSEEGVTEKSELTQSTSSQEQHSSGFNTGVTASGGYGPVSINSSVTYTVNESASQSEKSALNHSLTTTRKASARSKKEHKMSFKVASAAGTEDQQVRKIKNPFPDKATRADYYQLVRKWRVDLHRYGLRLTYDLMIPEPGSGILSKIREIQEITAALELGFGDPLAPEGSPAHFSLEPDDIDEGNVNSVAARYGATGIEPYPGYGASLKEELVSAGFLAEENAGYTFLHTQKITIPDGCAVTDAEVIAMNCEFWPHPLDQGGLEMLAPFKADLYNPSHEQVKLTPFPIPSWINREGDLQIAVNHWWVSQFVIVVKVDFAAATGALQTWRMNAYSAIFEAARARYEQYRQALKDRLARLQEEVGAQDPLSLRKVEREEVMKGVLRWLFGPGFEFAPSFPTKPLYPSNIGVIAKDPWVQAIWAYVMSETRAHGEIIKFLHQAIEWENMLYFLYPYFWSHPDVWEFKKYLDHPDLMHRAFLKSGSARVVLTIRPGFEKAFLSFFETGKTDEEHSYLTIANEMQAYAQTNYPGIRSANPIEDARPQLSPRQRKAWEEMQAIMDHLEEYRDKNGGGYPTTEQGLAELAQFGSAQVPPWTVPSEDPWGNAYVYAAPGVTNDYDLTSYGKDGAPGAPGGEDEAADITDEAADITSWADANLIGRWYEYTPTSALDIAFDETRPMA